MDKNKETENKKTQEEMQKDASKLFRKAFYAKAEEIEDRVNATDLEIDGARMEALYQRILKSVAETTEEPTEEPDKPGTSLKQSAEKQDEGKQFEEKEPAPETSKKILPMRKRHLYHAGRWVAVLVLVCVGVVGVSIQSQAGKDGLWSSIQRLIGVESRWEQKNNDENREYSDPEEVKAVRDIEDTLGVTLPEFFYWPDTVEFSEYVIGEKTGTFTIVYRGESTVVYFEGWYNTTDVSAMRSWENEGIVTYQEYSGTKYKIAEISDEKNETKTYYVEWNVGDTRYLLSGLSNLSEIDKILENIKN